MDSSAGGRISSAQASAAGSTGSQGRTGCSSSPAMAEASSKSCSMTCAPRVGTRSVKSQRAGRSRGFSSPIRRRQPAEAGNQRRAQRALQVDHRVVLSGTQGRAQSHEFRARLAAEGSLAPRLGGGEMEVVDEGLGGASRAWRGRGFSGQQRPPARLDGPVDHASRDGRCAAPSPPAARAECRPWRRVGLQASENRSASASSDFLTAAMEQIAVAVVPQALSV